MGFDQALKMLRKGHEMTRTEWNDNKMTVTLKGTTFMRQVPQDYVSVVFHPTVTDVLAMDWELVR